MEPSTLSLSLLLASAEAKLLGSGSDWEKTEVLLRRATARLIVRLFVADINARGLFL